MNISLQTTYNFCFHPFSPSHSPGKTVASLIAIVAATILTLGTFGILFAGVHLAECLSGKQVEQLDFSSDPKIQISFNKGQSGKSIAEVRENLEYCIKNEKISGPGLYCYMKSAGLSPHHPLFLTESRPTELAELFAAKRGITVQDFFRKYSFLELEEKWKANALKMNDEGQNANFKILGSMIADQNVSDLDLYRFMAAQKVRFDGGWFIGKGNHTNLLLTHRGMTPEMFFKTFRFADWNAQWHVNAKKFNDGANNKILTDIIQDQTISGQEVLKFFSDIGLRAKGGWLVDKKSNTPTPLNNLLFQVRPYVHGHLYPQSLAKGEAVQAPQPIESKKQEILDPIEHLVSINCHGSFAEDTFELPDDVYVLVPHPQGFEAPYVLLSPPSGITFEGMIYGQKDGNVPSSSSGGWHVYKPGDVVRNLRLSPWSCSKDVQVEYDSWKKTAPADDVNALDISNGIPQFAAVPAIDGKMKKLSYKGKAKSKIKVFGGTDLRRVIDDLRKKQPDGPLVVAPFACNAISGNNESVSCDTKEVTNIKSLFGNKK